MLRQQREHQIVEVPVAIVERHHDPTLVIVVERVVEREDALVGDELFQLTFEDIGRQLDLGPTCLLPGGTAGRRRHPGGVAPATPAG